MNSEEELGRVANYFYPGISFQKFSTHSWVETDSMGNYVAASRTVTTQGMSAEQKETIARLRDEFVANAKSVHYSFGSPFAAPGASDKVTQIIGNDWHGLKTDRFDQLRASLAAKYAPLLRV